MAASGKVLGTVTSVVGEAKATAADGTVRILQVGDVVHSDETITTSAAGAVNIALENGKTLDCGANSDLSLHESILGVSTAASNVPGTPGAAAPGSVEALQQAIASGQDPSQIAPATAAGGAPAAGGAGGDGSGGTPVVIDQANSSGPITAGIGTAGAGIAFPTPEFQLLPPTQQQPTVSVSVQVQVEVGVTPGETPGQVTVPTHPVVSTDATGIVEGTGGEAPRLVNFVIKLSQSFDTDVQVTYQIVSGPANPGVQADAAQTPSDYTGVLTATITIPAGATEFVVPVMIVQDHVVENNENFSIVLTNAENATIDPTHNSAVVTIQDDDTAPVAHADTNWTQEDTHIVATGNVIAGQAHAGAPSGSFADVQDTDADGDIPHVTTAGTFNGTYGTLVLNADGTYVYTLNNASAAVQGLDTGETLNDSFNYTASDGFNAPSSATLTVTIFGSNDVPEITVKTSGDIFASGAQGTVDEAALANGSNPSSNAEFVTGSFKVADTDGIDDIQSVTINGQTVAVGNLVNAVFHGTAGDMTVTSFSGGVANFTYELKHAVTDVANQAETDVFTLTTSDGTSNSAPANVTITIIDDVPSTNVTATQATSVLTVDETDLGTNATANFASDFSGGSSFGADGPGTVSNAIYTLSVNAGATGLVDTATGQAVTLQMSAGKVQGVISGGAVVFEVSVDASGNVTLDQQRAVMHTPDSGPDQSTSLASANLVVLTRSATITDADGDTANSSASINIGQALNFEDDAPSVNVSAIQAADTLTVDETTLATNASANFADNFTGSSAFGADGAGSLGTAYSLSVNAGSTGLVDSATGEAVTLQMSGGKAQGVISGGVVVFEVSVTAGGQVTLDQQRAVMHTPDSGPDQSTSLASANLIVLTRTDTITDKDGDTSSSSASIDLGSAIAIKDDAPSINVGRADVSADTLTVDETVLATNATANFADNFTGSSSFGADGAGTQNTVFSLGIGAGSTGLVDTATNQAVTLSLNGGAVEGRVSNGEGGFFVVFRVSVDTSGNVTLDQQRAVMHTPDSGPDQNTTLASADLIVLTRTDTITDKDGDSASDAESINIGTSLNFHDDAPSLDITGGDTSVIEGQTITNGTWTSASGADAPATTKVLIGVTEFNLNTAIDTGKGTLTVNSNGTWTFAAAPNQVNPQSVTFSVKITDKDLDSASDSYTITINDGANPGVTGGQVMTVNEAALADGSNPSSNGESDTATLTFTSGSDAIGSMVFGSTAGISVNAGLDETQSITWLASNGGRTLTGSIGGTAVIQLDLTGATSVAAGGNTGNVTVTATLLNNMLHQNSPDADSLVISGIQVVGTDTDGDTATHTFTGVTVLDDAPSLSAESIGINHTVGHYSGNYTFADGADDSAPPSAFGSGSLVWTNQPASVNFAQTGVNEYTATFVNGGETYFIITVKNDGTYDFNLVNAPGTFSESSGSLFSGITGGSNLASFTFGAEKFGGAFELVLTASDNNVGADTITISSTELGINGNSIQEQFGETLKLDVVQQAGFENATVTQLSIGIASTGSLKTNDDFNIVVTYKDATTATVNENYDGSGVLTFNIDPTKTVDFIEFHVITNNTNFKVTGITLEYDTKVNVDDDKLDFSLTAHDGDGDTASAGFSVTVLAGTAGNDTLFTGNGADSVSGGAGDDSISTAGGNDILIGGAGHDTLIGGLGSDTYVFQGPLNASTSDFVTGFNVAPAASGGDVLDLHDVLPVAAQGHLDLGTLGTYISVTTVGPNTVISVDADGGGAGAAVTVVTLTGVTGVTLSQLLTNNEIHT